ncbi:hypothetical protein NA57DRAFT_29083, partial [Rhizodiscina lignyota]
LSRYRSVRRQQSLTSSSPPPVPVPEHAALPPNRADMNQQNVQRSMSRYHRNRPATSAGAEQPQPVPQLPPQMPPQTQARPLRSPTRYKHISPQQSYDEIIDNYAQAPQRQRTTTRPGTAVRPPANDASRAEARQIIAGEAERQERMKAKIRAERKAQSDAQDAERRRRQQEEEQAERERRRRAAEEVQQKQLREAEEMQKKKREREEELALRQQRREEEAHRGLKASRNSGSNQMAQPVTPSKSSGGLFGMFKKRKGDEAPKSAEILAGPSSKSATWPEEQSKFIKQGGGGIVPGTDAPISAVNAGERRVKVECNDSSILLPVTPTTTPQDLIRSATTCLSVPINYSTAFLLESYLKVGLQRPLRKYEHVRDVLNSWDDDLSNTLLIMHATSTASDVELNASHVPKDRPAFGSGWFMHYSQKPGKWDKRYVALRADGQLTAAKNEAGKDLINVCHLSDFDIYSPTPKKAKKVKPPKKICYAIKSQQKSTMFMNTTTFVHFFCSNDKRIADDFYRAIQGWRSWYLVNVMGEGNKKKATEETTTSLLRNSDLAGVGARDIPGSRSGARHRSTGSLDSHYQLGSFKPVFDENHQQQPHQSRKVSASLSGSLPDDAPLAVLANNIPDTKAQYSRKMTVRNRNTPPSSFPGAAFHHSNSNSGGSNNRPSSSHSNHGSEQTFAENGLLGRTYSQRQRDVSGQAPARRSSFDGGSGLQRTPSIRSQRHHSADHSDIPGRTKSIRGNPMPKPLVDLTPKYKEPPQFTKKGKGFKPDHIGQGGLVEAATSGFQDAIVIPPSTDWRGRNVAGDTGRPVTSSNAQHDRTKSLRGHGVRVNGGPEGFTGTGLLASSRAEQGWGDGNAGRGVVSQNAKRGGPMLDMREESRFAQGSLLAKV